VLISIASALFFFIVQAKLHLLTCLYLHAAELLRHMLQTDGAATARGGPLHSKANKEPAVDCCDVDSFDMFCRCLAFTCYVRCTAGMLDCHAAYIQGHCSRHMTCCAAFCALAEQQRFRR
jgi:hypothetical protein